LCLCAGFLSYIQFYMRRGEFATLFAIGYARSGLLRQAFLQIVILNLAGFALGFALSALTAILLNALLYLPMGLAMPVSSGEALVRSACAPLFTATACFVPAWRVILALDPVNVLEGRG
jgi:ABC-type antimicrobial peptide transport system permease subunit